MSAKSMPTQDGIQRAGFISMAELATNFARFGAFFKPLLKQMVQPDLKTLPVLIGTTGRSIFEDFPGGGEQG